MYHTDNLTSKIYNSGRPFVGDKMTVKVDFNRLNNMLINCRHYISL